MTRWKASVLMQGLSFMTETVLSNNITRNRIVLSFKDGPRKPLGRRPGTSPPSPSPEGIPFREAIITCLISEQFCRTTNLDSPRAELWETIVAKRACYQLCLGVSNVFPIMSGVKVAWTRPRCKRRPGRENTQLFSPILWEKRYTCNRATPNNSMLCLPPCYF